MNILVLPGANFLSPLPIHSGTETAHFSQNIVIFTNNTYFPDTVMKTKRTVANYPPLRLFDSSVLSHQLRFWEINAVYDIWRHSILWQHDSACWCHFIS